MLNTKTVKQITDRELNLWYYFDVLLQMLLYFLYNLSSLVTTD